MIRFNCPNCNRYYELPNALAKLPLLCKQCGQRITPPSESTAPPRPKSAAPPFSPIPVPPPKPAAPPPAPSASPAPPPAAPPPELPEPIAAAPAGPPLPHPPPPKPGSRQVEVATEAPPPPAPKPPPPGDDDDGGVLVAKPDSTPDIDFNIGGPTAQSLSEANRARPSGVSSAERTIRPPGLSGSEQARPPESGAPKSDAEELEVNLDLLPRASPPPPPAPPSPRVEAPAPPDEKPAPRFVPILADLAALATLVVAGVFLGEVLARKSTGAVLSEAGSAPKFPPIDLLLWAGPVVVFGLVYLLLSTRELTVGAWLRRRLGGQ